MKRWLLYITGTAPASPNPLVEGACLPQHRRLATHDSYLKMATPELFFLIKIS
jgi:hypothetical protein